MTRGGGRGTWGGNGGQGFGSEEPGKQVVLGQRDEVVLLDRSPNGPTPPHLILLSSPSHSVLGLNSPILIPSLTSSHSLTGTYTPVPPHFTCSHALPCTPPRWPHAGHSRFTWSSSPSLPLIGPAARPAPCLAPTLRGPSPRCPAQLFPDPHPPSDGFRSLCRPRAAVGAAGSAVQPEPLTVGT